MKKKPTKSSTEALDRISKSVGTAVVDRDAILAGIESQLRDAISIVKKLAKDESIENPIVSFDLGGVKATFQVNLTHASDTE